MFKNKILPMLLSLAIAIGLWAYVVTFVSSEREETFYDIPVSYQGEALLVDRGLMITSEERPTVTLTLYGNRGELSKLNNTNITILADLSKIGSSGTHSLSYNIYYPGDIPSNAFTVQSQYPGMVQVMVEKRLTKEVPIAIRYNGIVPENFIADKENVELDRTSVSISGPASVVDRITQAIVEVDLEGKSASFSESYRFTLCDVHNDPVDAKMVQTDAAEVNLTLYIKRVMEIPLRVTVEDGGGATEETSEITIDPQVIKVAGNEAALAQLEELVLGTIKLGELAKDEELSFEIKLPDGVENLSGKTEAKVSVQFSELRTKTIIITDFVPLNVPEGLEAEFITQELSVTVRGPKDIMARITSEHVSVTVDFLNAQAGTYTIKANVVMAEGFTKAGAIGTYRLNATLKEPELEEQAE